MVSLRSPDRNQAQTFGARVSRPWPCQPSGCLAACGEQGSSPWKDGARAMARCEGFVCENPLRRRRRQKNPPHRRRDARRRPSAIREPDREAPRSHSLPRVACAELIPKGIRYLAEPLSRGTRSRKAEVRSRSRGQSLVRAGARNFLCGPRVLTSLDPRGEA